MKKNFILIATIVGSAAIHLGVFVPLLLIVSGLVPLTESSVAILFAATVVNVLALVKLHTWNSQPNS
jgi:hypothetical protein